ncbi:MAG: hypothetical protein ISR58_15855 [Anaerolineales bacterium]|nr:hypothetical protein [Chloroflexota bacterium]MBL6982648.1 hypothetical protein [Anaerolineales bacterium]
MKTTIPVLKILGATARLLGVVVLMVVAFFVSAIVSSADAVQLSPEEAALSTQMIFLVSATNALILSYLALRSRWHGWKLAGALFLTQYGIETFMSQIETVVFNQALQLTSDQAVTLFVSGFVRALIFAPLAVVVLGKTHKDESVATENTRLIFSPGGWATRLTILAALYTLIYFVFGYFVAWQSPELRQFYSGSTDILPFFAHMARALTTDPILVLVQFVRGYLWVLIVLPVVRMFKGGVLETCFALALVLAVLLSDFILFPNPYMPETVRMAHFTELWSSMAFFGALTGWVLLKE